ncbi:MAG: hypothetical protein IJI77_05720 [Erysipelotrichaceae bacterium]|nr:hypothetical protein [Erysipelotrichaceae bacterium]
MKKKNLSYVYLLLLILAMGILVFTTVNGVAAATPNIISDEQTSHMDMDKIGVALQKADSNGDFTDISTIVYNSGGEWSITSSGNLFDDDASLKPGKTIDAQFRVKNYGEIGEYVRAIIYKYWVDEKGNKIADADISPDMIIPILSSDSAWIKDMETDEKIFLYYSKMLETDDATTVFLTGVKIDGEIKKYYDAKEYVYYKEDGSVDYTKTVYDYKYNGKSFVIEVEVDAVQGHHPKEAIRSAWGKNVTIENDMITALN